MYKVGDNVLFRYNLKLETGTITEYIFPQYTVEIHESGKEVQVFENEIFNKWYR